MAGVTQKSQVAQIFDTMSYGPAPESQKEADKWLDNHGRKVCQAIFWVTRRFLTTPS